MAYYELISILRPDLSTEQVEEACQRVESLVDAKGGSTMRTELWGRRELAYSIKKSPKGYYTHHLLDGGGAMVQHLETHLRIQEDVLKFLTVRIQELPTEASALLSARWQGDRSTHSTYGPTPNPETTGNNDDRDPLQQQSDSISDVGEQEEQSVY